MPHRIGISSRLLQPYGSTTILSISDFLTTGGVITMMLVTMKNDYHHFKGQAYVDPETTELLMIEGAPQNRTGR